MLHLIFLTLSCVVLVLGQASLPDLAMRPNLLLVIAVYAGQFYPPITGLLLSFLLGYFLDLSSGGLLGLNAFSMVVICYLSFILSKRIVLQSRLAQLLLVFIFYLVYGYLVYLLFSFFNLEITGYSHFHNTVRDGSAAALFSIFMISAIKRSEKFFRFQNDRTAGTGEIKV